MMSELFSLILNSGLTYGFIIGFTAWGLGKAIQIALNLFTV